MLHKLIIAMALISGLAYGQSTSGWQTVTMQDGDSDLYTNGVSFADDFAGYYFRPSYGSFVASGSPFLVAESVVVTNGTIDSGTVTNTWVEDGSYFIVDETGQFEIYFTFQDGGEAPRLLDRDGGALGVRALLVQPDRLAGPGTDAGRGRAGL